MIQVDSRAEAMRQMLLWKLLKELAEGNENLLRDGLQADAVHEFTSQKTAPSWRVQGVGQVVLPVSHDTVVITDLAAVLEWVKRNAPGEVFEVVNPPYLKQLRARARIVRDKQTGAVVVTDGEGTVIPGLGVQAGGTPKSISFTPDTEAVAEVAEEAAGLLRKLAADLGLQLPEPTSERSPG